MYTPTDFHQTTNGQHSRTVRRKVVVAYEHSHPSIESLSTISFGGFGKRSLAKILIFGFRFLIWASELYAPSRVVLGSKLGNEVVGLALEELEANKEDVEATVYDAEGNEAASESKEDEGGMEPGGDYYDLDPV